MAGVGGDQVVGLEAGLFHAGDVEGLHRLADQRELRHEIGGGRRALCLVGGEEVAAEGRAGGVEDHGEMGRPDAGRGVVGLAQQLPDHVAEARDRADRQPVGLARQGRQRVVGAEDVARPVDQEHVVAGADGAVMGGIGRGVGHGADYITGRSASHRFRPRRERLSARQRVRNADGGRPALAAHPPSCLRPLYESLTPPAAGRPGAVPWSPCARHAPIPAACRGSRSRCAWPPTTSRRARPRPRSSPAPRWCRRR
ncbi:hypothetical protein A6302_00349 [Methylobrevis pamukkalensis]|uniref:Uncharacterized protein n=1 Tax=Methylobrevis pamukkalensis TaxID=1439726 RepID=A0A1E3H7K4_9HYPH|nr:hypothetical protein A6302_00349 [Methylobrevis pamukkalensis]